jgi:hypothetical protein
MAGVSRYSKTKRTSKNKRCFAIKDDGTICGAYLNSYHDDIICFACRHRFAWGLKNPKIATEQEFKKQKGESNGG